MTQRNWCRLYATSVIAFASLVWPISSTAQTPTGQARAVQLSTPLSSTVLADTGTLGGASDARDAVMAFGQIGSVFAAEVLHAVTIGASDGALSQVSLANVGVNVGGTAVTADMVMASVNTALGTPARASALVSSLAINGVPIDVTGIPNQTIAIPGGQVIVNQQSTSGAATTVNALRVKVLGAADVIVGSATAGIQ